MQIYDLARADEWEAAAELQERLLMCFFELITQGDAGYSASTWALGGFKAGLKVKGVIRSTCAGAPLHSFSAAEEERVADVMRRAWVSLNGICPSFCCWFSFRPTGETKTSNR